MERMHLHVVSKPGTRKGGMDTLRELALTTLAENAKHVQGLEGVPEDLVLELFRKIIEMGRLDEDVLEIFLRTGYDSVKIIVKRLEIVPLPPRIPVSSNPWLGESPKY